MADIDIDNLSEDELRELAEMVHELDERDRHTKFDSFFPDEGEYRRELYPKHVAFFEAGAVHKERAFIAGNRVGKTIAGAYEMACHLTGRYPHWWVGKRFDKPIKAWAAGVSNEATRDILQKELVGDKRDQGTGMIPAEYIADTTTRPGVPEAFQDVYVKHISGGVSKLTLKSYEQKRKGFQGTAVEVIWLDEEPTDRGIYSECLTRTMTTKGIVMCTFTPLEGLSDIVMSFLPGGKFPEDGIVPPSD